MSLPFIDLKAQLARIREPMHAAVLAAVDSGAYINGAPVLELEERLSALTGAAFTISCANGTDALALALRAWGTGPGDAVFCPSFTFAASAEVIPWFGAEPVFVDILPDTYNMDPDHLDRAISQTLREGRLRPRAIIAVDLFGALADYPKIAAVARKYGIKLIADCAQSFGATLGGKHAIAWADAVTTSFFPAKPLGCYGDGGAVQTNDPALRDLLDSLKWHGKASARDIAERRFEHEPRYLNVRIGMNSRLDTLQAAVLLQKLDIFPAEIAARGRIAARYSALLDGLVAATPRLAGGAVSVWAQYTIETADRDGLAAHLKRRGVPTAVYYPVPMHRQSAYAHFPVGPGGLPVSEEKAGRVLALPMHPYLDEATQDVIVAAIAEHNGRA